MNSRQRLSTTFEFASPDRLPVIYHSSEAGLHVHGRKLLDLFRKMPPDARYPYIPPVTPMIFEDAPLPAPKPETLAADGKYYEEVTDGWGTRWGLHTFGIGGQPVGYPFASWSEARDYAFPALPDLRSPGFQARHGIPPAIRENYLVFAGWVSLFQQLYALRPMEDVLMDLATGEPDMLDFVERLANYCHQTVDFLLAAGVDVVVFGDDWAAQSGPLTSPALFRELFKPHYRSLFDKVHQAGARVLFHCCGKLDYLLDELFALDIDCLWHQCALYDEDAFASRCREAGVTVLLHLDRQHLIPHGTPAEIQATVRRFAKRHKALGGGAIFYVEIENDAPFENVKALIEGIDGSR